MGRTLSLMLLLLNSLMPAAGTQCGQPQITTDAKFEPGQIWSYKTRPGEEHSTVTILRIEKTPKMGTFVHIRIDGIHFRDCAGKPATEGLEHAPFSRAALDASLVAKVGSVSKLPDYSAGYQDWLSHCGGVYTISVAQAVAVDDATFGAGLGCH